MTWFVFVVYYSYHSFKVLCSSDISNNNREGSQYIDTEIIQRKCNEQETKENREVNDICHQEQQTSIQNVGTSDSGKVEDTCFLNDASKTNATNSGRLQDYRLNLTGVEGTLLEAVPEDSAVPQVLLSEHCAGIETEGTLYQAIESHKPIEKLSSDMDINNTKVQDTPSDITVQTINCNHETKKQEHPHIVPLNIPESNASDVSECSIATNATNATGASHRDNTFLNQIMTKTEALTARQQVALWLTRTSMSDLSSMPSLKNIVYPPSVANKEPPSRSSQSSHCSCYHHHTQDKHYTRRNKGGNTCNNRPLSTAMSDCCFDATATLKQANHCIHSSVSPHKANVTDVNGPHVPKCNTIRRNYSTKSLMGGFSFGFRGVGSDKSFKDNKREKDTCEEKESLMPSPIRKCETVIALSGLNPGSPCGADGAVDDSVACSNIATSTIVKRRHHQHYHNHPSSHSCSVSNVRLHCAHGSTSPSNNATPHTSKRSTSLSLFKKLSSSSSKERSCNR